VRIAPAVRPRLGDVASVAYAHAGDAIGQRERHPVAGGGESRVGQRR
jgi:hypothetical protein